MPAQPLRLMGAGPVHERLELGRSVPVPSFVELRLTTEGGALRRVELNDDAVLKLIADLSRSLVIVREVRDRRG